jgi:oxygen-dependent protoporphyrinogen oxidase
MKKVKVIGAGFSGLSLAYHLRRLGLLVEVYERAEDVGGLISTITTPSGLVETAANGFMADADLEEMFSSLKVVFAERKPERRNRFIFWGSPKRWPLTLATTLKLLWTFVRIKFGNRNLLPQPNQTVANWGRLAGGQEFVERMLAPALQGIYAGDVEQLSSSLILGNLLLNAKPVRKGKYRATVAPALGMQHLLAELRNWLQDHGVVFHLQQNFVLKASESDPTVLCTSAWDASEIVREFDAKLSYKLAQCQPLPLVSVTAFFQPKDTDLKGFGCLFPEKQGFHALGVLFNSSIFAGRSDLRSETWIYGGAIRWKDTSYSDAEICEVLQRDRQKLSGQTDKPEHVQITRWPKAIPHYSTTWEQVVADLELRAPLYLHGNYLGNLGLAKIHRQSIALAKSIKESYE